MERMKAIRVHRYGGPEVLRLEDVPRPTPGYDELLIRVHAASVNPIDRKIRQGIVTDSLPFIPGCDLSGVIEETGWSVTRFKKGDEIYASLSVLRDGAYAEYAIAKEADAALKPRTLNRVHAAAVPLAGLTAWQALFKQGELAAGQKVLIHGAAGGVGSFAVQFARARGAQVLATASGRNQAFLRNLGVEQPIDYEKTRFEEVAREVDVVLDTIGGETQERSWVVLRKGGVLVSIVQVPSAEEAAKAGVRARFLMHRRSSTQLAEIATLVDAGQVRAFVETVLPLSDARRAHEMIQSGHGRGKIVLRVA
jgi:NADPH:quinone reductase-like Zn-dependent oxidoreductase